MVSLISFLLIASTFTASATFTFLFSKLLYQTKSKGIYDEEPVYFNKPWFLDWLMFISEFLILVVHWITCCFKKARANQKNKRINDEKITSLIPHQKPVVKEWKIILRLFFPAVLDLLSGLCNNLALMWIPVSIAQLLKGSLTIFLALLTIFYRKRRLLRNEWIGVCLVTLSIFALGTAALLNDGYLKGEGKQTTLLTILGVFLALLGMAMMAFLSVYEEKLLHDANVPAMLTIGWEGLYGLLIITFVFFPVCYFLPGPEGYAFHENELDAFVMLKNNWFAVVCAGMYVLCSFFFNTLFMIIMEIKNALTSSILQQLSYVTVWISTLLIYYLINPEYGEMWTRWSFLELGGFILMVTGVFVYEGIIKIGFLMGNSNSSAEKPAALKGKSADPEMGQIVGGVGIGPDGAGDALPVGTPFVVELEDAGGHNTQTQTQRQRQRQRQDEGGDRNGYGDENTERLDSSLMVNLGG